MNAELWSRPDETSKRNTLICWFKDHNIIIENIEELTIEELREIYIYYETTKLD